MRNWERIDGEEKELWTDREENLSKDALRGETDQGLIERIILSRKGLRGEDKLWTRKNWEEKISKERLRGETKK